MIHNYYQTCLQRLVTFSFSTTFLSGNTRYDFCQIFPSNSFPLAYTCFADLQMASLVSAVSCQTSSHSFECHSLERMESIIVSLGLNKRPKPMERAIEQWIRQLPLEVATKLVRAIDSDLSQLTLTFMKYDNFLLLNPPKRWILSAPVWKRFLPPLWDHMASTFKVTHVAFNGPIPLDTISNATEMSSANTMRSPTSLQPLYGEFGDPAAKPGLGAFDSTFWASATQYGVKQIWAPLHTMFSRGNISEKERIFRKYARHRDGDHKASVADLYGGIGYFSMFYRKAVSDVVLAWEINPWSVEGFRRGAIANGWGKEVWIVDRGEDPVEKVPALKNHGHFEKGLIVFAESNDFAFERLERIKTKIPPVNHVNCGYLPSSKASWETAAKVLNANGVGWIHVHENDAIKDIDDKRAAIEQYFQRIHSLTHPQGDANGVRCATVHQVKTFAPGVMHCVFDVEFAVESSEETRSTLAKAASGIGEHAKMNAR